MCGRQDRHQDGVVHALQALELGRACGHRSLGEREFETCAWETLGYAHRQMGDHGRAVACYQDAVILFGSGGYRFAQASTLTRMGEAHHAVGHLDAARDAWRQSLDIHAELDLPEADGYVSDSPT